MVSRGDRKSPTARRLEILETAIGVADALGLDRITSRDVASAMGVTPGLVHHYFSSTDELIEATFAHFAKAEQNECQRMLDALPPMPALRAYLWRGLHDANRPVSARLWMGAWIAASRRARLAAEVEKQMQADQKMLRELLIRGVADNVFTVSDPRISANRILALLDGILIQILMRGAADAGFGEVDDLVWELVEREVGLTPGDLSKDIDTTTTSV